ncbi:TonB-dependent receptor [Escherichia coli]|nr:TonB-dependent receptor [Escherichia coli]
MKRVLIPGVILCGADMAQAVDDKNMYMHFFEEMTVYAPVPVPVNGNTHYTSESIERLPTGNGNISDLLRTNPAVRMDSTQSTSLNQGDIRPEKISIHGASPYQNAYLIDGISATNNLNPANESDASSATNISGMSQGYYLDVSLLDNVTLYDSFVPVEFGRFNGGVIDAKIKRFNADDSKVKLGYRTTRSDWLTSHIDENNKSAFNQGSSGSTYYSPDFKKNFYTLSFNQELADNFGVTAGLSRRQSDITRADYVSNDGIVAGRAQYKNVIDTALSKFTWFASDRFTHDLTLKYTGSSRDYNTSTFPQSDREMGNKSYGLAWDMDTQLAWAKLRTTVGWDHISDYTRHDHDIWYTELSCTYGDITGRCTRGGLGHISQAVDNYTFKTRLDWQKFAVGNVSHQPYFGAEYIYSDAWTERHNQSESYVINAAGKKTNHTIYHKGKGSLGIDNYTLYMADHISWRNVSLMPGVRYDYDNYLSNHNISPRFMTEWDIFADQTSMITAGYNRYYGGNILDMGLRDIRNSWTESVSGNKTLTRYQDLKTPYNDELAMGLQQKIGKNVIARANYVYREAHDQISKSSRTDSATKTTITEYNNDGKTKTHSFNLSFELAEPLHIRQVDINPQIVFSYIKSKGNLSLNNGYEESNTGDNQVVYNGNLVSYDSVPVADFNNPLKISLNMDFTHQPSGLVWANTLAWQEARKARIILGKTNAQYISEYSDYKQYVDEKLDSSLTWDTRLSWTPQFLKQQNLTISADILNVLITRYLGSIKHSDSPLAAGKPLTRATDNASVTVKEQNEPVAQVSQWKRYDSRTPVNLATRMALDAFNVALAKDLRVNIREQASGAYSVSSRLSVDPQAKDISHLLAFTCQPERHDELLTLANEVMVKRLAKGISEQELNEYQQNVQRSLDIQQRSVQQLANTIVNSLIQYDDPATWTEQEQLLKQMTVENVNTAVKQYLSHPVNTYTGVLLPK